MIVIDASVALKLVRRKDEKYINEALRLLGNHLDGKEQIAVPYLLFLEIANALVTKTDTTTDQVTRNLTKLFEFKFKQLTIGERDIINSSRLAKKLKTSVYDMLYAVVARANKCTLYTADENFVKKLKTRWVKHISEVAGD